MDLLLANKYLQSIKKYALLLFRSKSLKLKSKHEPFTQVAHDKRVTMSESVRSLLKKEQL